MGYPPGVNIDTCENNTFPILRMQAVITQFKIMVFQFFLVHSDLKSWSISITTIVNLFLSASSNGKTVYPCFIITTESF